METKTDRLVIAESIPGDLPDEDVELLINNLREQLLDRLHRAGFAVREADVRGLVRGRYGSASRQAEVWAPYTPHTPEHRAELVAAYEDGQRSEQAAHDLVHDTEQVDGPPRLPGPAWAAMLAELSTSPYDTEPVGVTEPVLHVLDVAWRRGWEDARRSHEGHTLHSAPYKRIVKP